MTARAVAVLAMRLLALFVVVRGLHGALSAFEHLLLNVEVRTLLTFGVLSNAVQIAIGGLIWLVAEPLAVRALPEASPDADRSDQDEPTLNVSALDLHAIAFSVLGLYLFAQGLFLAGSSIGSLLQLRGTEDTAFGFGEPFLTQMKTQALAALAFGLAGLWIAFGARGLAAFLRRMWFEGRGVLKIRRIEIVDPDGRPRAELAVEPEMTDGREDVTLTFFDEELRPRLRMGTEAGAPRVDHIREPTDG